MEVQQLPAARLRREPTLAPAPVPPRADRTVPVFWLLAALHVATWTLLPALTQPNAPLDVVEMLYFGHEWQMGYFKHPPLVSWLAEAAYQLAGRHVWGVYLLAQLCVAASFWAAWRLARELLPPREALLAALLPAACWFYSFSSTEYNHNVGLYPFWTLAILFAWRAATDGRSRWWIATGVVLGLGLLAKYTMAVLAFTMLVFLIAHPALRPWWRRPGPYLTLAAAWLVVQPHFLWALAHGFPAVDFALARTQTAGLFAKHLLGPLSFLAGQALALTPMALVLAVALRARARARRPRPAERLGRDFVLAMVLGPPAVCLAISALGGLTLRTFHGSQLWTCAGLAALGALRPAAGRLNLRAASIALATVAFLFVLGFAARNAAAPHSRREGSRIHFPGRALAAQVEQAWHQRFGQPLRIVGGEWWLAANVALYGSDRPQVYGGSDPDMPNVDPRFSPWLADAAVRRAGAIFLWDADRFEGRLPSLLRNRFSGLQRLPTLELAWQTDAGLKPLRVDLAILPPSAAFPAPL